MIGGVSTEATHRLILGIAVLFLFNLAFPKKAMALGEVFDLYDSPQGLAMGNAFSADATGYAANYYNPAGLAKGSSKSWVITPIDFEGILSFAGAARDWAARSFGISRLNPELANHPGSYDFFRGTLIPSVTRKNFGVSVLDSYYYAAQSDGKNIDINAGQDLGPTVGAAVSLWENRLKLGIATKFLLRNQIKGTFDAASLATDSAVMSNMKEGFGIGVDAGLLFRLPWTYVPTLALVAHDIGNTTFRPTHVLLNTQSTGAPDPLEQSYDGGFSIHPILWKGLRATIAVEVRNLERSDLPFRKRSHVGLQIESDRDFFFWAGANQLYPTGGLGYHVRGGDLEIGTYAEDIGEGTSDVEDRRFLIRYTVGF